MVPRRKKQLTMCTNLNCIQWTFSTNRSHWKRTLFILPLLVCLFISYDDFSFIFSSHILGQRSKFCKHKCIYFNQAFYNHHQYWSNSFPIPWQNKSLDLFSLAFIIFQSCDDICYKYQFILFMFDMKIKYLFQSLLIWYHRLFE